MKVNKAIRANESRHLTPRRKGKIACFLHICDLMREHPDAAPQVAREEIERVTLACKEPQAA